jgi:hypothetical protein
MVGKLSNCLTIHGASAKRFEAHTENIIPNVLPGVAICVRNQQFTHAVRHDVDVCGSRMLPLRVKSRANLRKLLTEQVGGMGKWGRRWMVTMPTVEESLEFASFHSWLVAFSQASEVESIHGQ